MDLPIAVSNVTGIAGSCTAMTCATLNWLGQYHDAVSTMIGVCGVLVAFGGLGSSIYFQHKRDKRERKEHDQRMFQRRSTDLTINN